MQAHDDSNNVDTAIDCNHVPAARAPHASGAAMREALTALRVPWPAAAPPPPRIQERPYAHIDCDESASDRTKQEKAEEQRFRDG